PPRVRQLPGGADEGARAQVRPAVLEVNEGIEALGNIAALGAEPAPELPLERRVAEFTLPIDGDQPADGAVAQAALAVVEDQARPQIAGSRRRIGWAHGR